MGQERDDDNEDYTGLTAAEIAAMQEAEGDENADADMTTAGDDTQAKQSTDGQQGNESEAANSETQSQQEATESGQQVAAASAEAPLYVARAPDNADTRLTEIKGELRSLKNQWESGELSDDEYDAKTAGLETEQDRIKTDKIRAEVSADMTRQQAERQYGDTLKSFFGGVRESGFNYHADASKDALRALDARVKALAPLYDDNPDGWKRALQAAHKLVADEFGIKAAKPKAEQTTSKPEQGKSRAPDLSALPPTAVRGPSAGASSTNAGEFSHLDGLSGIALEKAIAKMSPEQLERWTG